MAGPAGAPRWRRRLPARGAALVCRRLPAGAMGMTVSIVIPCFNHARFVAAAIESALAQTWADCEVVVVDDGSTDDSGAIAARYDRVRVVAQPNRGLSEARNAGLAAAQGDIIIFLDADDRLRPAAAAAAVHAFADN